MAEPKLPLVARKNIKENEEKLNEQKEKINKIVELSTDITIEPDYPALHALSDKNGYNNRVGDITGWLLEGFASKIEYVFKEETAKAALQAAWTTGVIRVRTGVNKKGENKYNTTEIENGDLVITAYSCSNTGSVGEDLLDKLGDNDSGLSVKAAQSVKESQESRSETLQKIQEHIGLSNDVTFDIDWPSFSQKVDAAGYKDRVGEIVNWSLDGLKSKITNNFTDDLSKQALQSAWTTGVIKFEWGTLKKGENKYHTTEIRDGDIAVTLYSVSNTGETGHELLGSLAEPSSGLPLKSSLNIKENEEKKEENLKKIQDATGLSTDVTVDIDWATIEAFTKKAGYDNRLGDVVYDWIFGGLASNISRMCEEELTKEAIQEAWTTGVIRLEENKKISYHAVEFTNGDLVIQYNNLCSNTGSVGSDIESKL